MKKLRELQQMAKNPHESEMARAFASIIANLEHDLLDAVEALHDAQGIEDPVTVEGSRDDRVTALLDLADAASSGDLKTFWFEDVADLDQPESAAEYAGLTDETWANQIESWAAMYRDLSDEFEDWGDRAIAAYHVEGEFGVGLDEFEREVVGYSRKSALKSALAGNFTVGIAGVRRAAAVARSAEPDAETGE